MSETLRAKAIFWHGHRFTGDWHLELRQGGDSYVWVDRAEGERPRRIFWSRAVDGWEPA